jgi:hypothetical protein
MSEPSPLVTMTITVHRDGKVESDVQTHNNSYSEVAIGLAAVRKEIVRVFEERRQCPYYPKTPEDAHRKIIRNPPSEQE